MISEVYQQASPLKNLLSIVTKEIHLHGFIVSSFLDKYSQQFYAEVPSMISKGKIKYQEEKNIGLHTAGHAIRAVLKGENKAKSVVFVADDE
jgi:NADPH-dependent curcumin reductase CurA